MKRPIFIGRHTVGAAPMRYSLPIFALLSSVAFFYPRDSVISSGDEVIGHASKQNLGGKKSQGNGGNNPVKLGAQKMERVRQITSSLPYSFEKGGGLIFFLHSPKTGGTTIRKNFAKMEGVEYFFGQRKSDFERAFPAIDEALNNKSNDTVFVEVHAKNCPSLFHLRDTLTTWRDTAQRNRVPVFFFTILRDPVEYAVSYFNFFHVQTSRKMDERFELCDATVDNFLRLMRNSPQCAFLVGGDRALFPTPQKPVPERCYNVVYDLIRETMDWVGTTENLYYETIQVLHNLTNSKPSLSFRPYNMAMRVDERLAREDLNDSVVEIVLERSMHDVALYEALKSEY